MSKDRGLYITSGENPRLYLLAQKLKDISTELNKLSEKEKKIVIERADQKHPFALKELYNDLNEYMGL